MSWFSNSDITANKPAEINYGLAKFSGQNSFVESNGLDELSAKAAMLLPGSSVWFKTEGAWSNHQLLDRLLEITGPAEVSFCTWAICEEAITAFIEWKESGRITQLHAVIDNGLRNRKPHIYQQAVKAFPSLKIEHCHAKATVLVNERYQLTCIGSANYTRNPRIEVGVLVFDAGVAEANSSWIKQKIYGTE